MTAEKHPLETVREALDVATVTINTGGRITRDTEVYKIMKAALTTLTLYMGQTQSCAECERLARENARYREAIRDLAVSAKPMVAGHEYVGGRGKSLQDCLEKHAATIAAAGGE